MIFGRRIRSMARKRHTAEKIVAKLRQVDVLMAQGRQVADAVTEVTYYRWRNEYGGLKGDQVKRLKELETQNTRLRRAVSDLTLDKLILAEAAKGIRRKIATTPGDEVALTADIIELARQYGRYGYPLNHNPFKDLLAEAMKFERH
jgi:putative transposase